jgi:hypothetical protein
MGKHSMKMDRSTVLAGAVGLPLVPAALDAASPLARRVFVFDPQKGVAEIVSAILGTSFGLEVDFVHEGAERARSPVDRQPHACGAVFWRLELKLHVAEVWSPVSANELRCPFSMRQFISQVEAVTGWPRSDTILRP